MISIRGQGQDFSFVLPFIERNADFACICFYRYATVLDVCAADALSGNADCALFADILCIGQAVIYRRSDADFGFQVIGKV